MTSTWDLECLVAKGLMPCCIWVFYSLQLYSRKVRQKPSSQPSKQWRAVSRQSPWKTGMWVAKGFIAAPHKPLMLSHSGRITRCSAKTRISCSSSLTCMTYVGMCKVVQRGCGAIPYTQAAQRTWCSILTVSSRWQQGPPFRKEHT